MNDALNHVPRLVIDNPCDSGGLPGRSVDQVAEPLPELVDSGIDKSWSRL
jgi:hypothetical protein